MTKLEWIRCEMKVTVFSLACEAGIPETVIRKYERLGVYPSIDEMMAIGFALGVKPDRIFGEDWQKNASPMSAPKIKAPIANELPTEMN